MRAVHHRVHLSALRSQVPGGAADITVDLTQLGFAASCKVHVLDVWSGVSLGVHSGSYTATNVPLHDTVLLRLSAVDMAIA